MTPTILVLQSINFIYFCNLVNFIYQNSIKKGEVIALFYFKIVYKSYSTKVFAATVAEARLIESTVPKAIITSSK